MSVEDIAEIEENEAYADDNNASPPSDIVSFNESRSCADLVRMHSKKQLDINPDFQRDFVWSEVAQTRFIDSLMKELPIPSICIALDYKRDKRLVIDGLQRMSTIIRFLNDDDWRLYRAKDIDENISGKTVAHIKQHQSEIYGRIENLTIPVTVIRYDYEMKSHREYLFTIFHRLNSGGSKLTNQEIRNCIYSGTFNALLRETVKSDLFKNIFEIKHAMQYRMKYEELLLRVFAFYDNLDDYKGGMSNFISDYMYCHREENNEWISNKKNIIERSLLLINKCKDGRGNIVSSSKTLAEAILIGIAKNIDFLEKNDQPALLEKIAKLKDDKLFASETLRNDLSNATKVKIRISRSIEIFAGS